MPLRHLLMSIPSNEAVASATRINDTYHVTRDMGWCQSHDLLAAILADAHADMCRNCTTMTLKVRRRDAWLWFKGADAPYTFEFVCEMLNLSASAVRKAVFADAARCALAPRGKFHIHHPHRQRPSVAA
jgi:hypothetical protein